MDYDDLIRKSIKQFLNGRMPEETAKLYQEGVRYTPDYFNDLEKELDADTGKAKKPKADKEDMTDGI